MSVNLDGYQEIFCEIMAAGVFFTTLIIVDKSMELAPYTLYNSNGFFSLLLTY